MNDVFQLSSGRKSLSLDREGQIESWSYDVVELKLSIDELQATHPGGERSRPTLAMLQAFASTLIETYGLADCTVEIAFQIYYIVNLQFADLHQSIARQLATLVSADTNNS